jgi:hypothetical protein
MDFFCVKKRNSLVFMLLKSNIYIYIYIYSKKFKIFLKSPLVHTKHASEVVSISNRKSSAIAVNNEIHLSVLYRNSVSVITQELSVLRTCTIHILWYQSCTLVTHDVTNTSFRISYVFPLLIRNFAHAFNLFYSNWNMGGIRYKR